MDANDQTLLLPKTLTEPSIRRLETADYIYIMQGSLGCLAFRRDDPAARNIVIATLLEARLKGRVVAKLVGVSPAQVTKVKKAVARGGLRAAADVRRGGRERQLQGERLEEVRALRAGGATHREIAKQVGMCTATVSTALQGMPAGRSGSQVSRTPREVSTAKMSAHAIELLDNDADDDGPDELVPCEALPPGPAEHPSAYAGTVLLCAMVQMLGVPQALAMAGAKRRLRWGYTGIEVMYALICGWAAGHRSLESMHERDARGLGVILGLERSPSVRTLHRAIQQMTQTLRPLVLGAALLRGAASAIEPSVVYGIDGHFKKYTGKERIDKGWDSKSRIVRKGLQDVYVTDQRGCVLYRAPVVASDRLSLHVLEVARELRAGHDEDEQIVVAFDRGGFAFDVLNQLDAEGFGYITYVLDKVKTPELSGIAPSDDGIGSVEWTHGSLSHAARLLVRRDGAHLIPMVTNLLDVEPATVVERLRGARAMQENGFKAARAFVAIDALNDRGGATHAPDDRLVPNPERAAVKAQKAQIGERLEALTEERPVRGKRKPTQIADDMLFAELQEITLDNQLDSMPVKVPTHSLDPEAERAWLRTRNRALLLPLKLAADNARRLLLGLLDAALSPSDAPCDESSRTRTLLALIRAPGTLRFTRDEVHVTLTLPLPPTPHARLAHALEALDSHDLRFTDGERRLRVRLAPRPTRSTLPHKVGAS